jgi:hypothetical protein
MARSKPTDAAISRTSINGSGQRADAAYDQGDMFNFDLWTRINWAMKQFLQSRHKPNIDQTVRGRLPDLCS